MSDAVSKPGDGERLADERREMFVKTSRPEIVVFEVDAAGDVGATPHFHKQHVDSFYVMEGELEFTVDGETIVVGAATFVSVPVGVVHAFKKHGPGRARYLNIHTPACRFDEYLRKRNAGEDLDPADYDVDDV